MKITFHGAARTVTGSRHLIELDNGKQVLLDGGLFQGSDIEVTDAMNRDLGFDPAAIDYIILSHAHMDHSGNLPRLFKEGFRGKIYATPPTCHLCEIMLMDSAHIHAMDNKILNKLRKNKGFDPVSPLYNKGDVGDTIKRFVKAKYNKYYQIDECLGFEFLNAGHILGSAMIKLNIEQKGQTTTLCYTSDVGRPVNSLLKPPEPIPDSDYLLCESTYGNRLHQPFEEADRELYDVIYDTCSRKKGKLLIPAFSLGRCQEVILSIEKLFRKGKMPPVEVFVDSPLALKATNITFQYPEYFNDDLQDYLSKHDDPFGFEGLHYVRSKDQSKALNQYNGPCIIISASGMLEGGRAVHHTKALIGNPDNTILFVGFATPESLGGKLQAGNDPVEILGKEYQVKAHICKTDNFSAHADYKDMLHYLDPLNRKKIRNLFLVHGEGSSQTDFRDKLNEAGFNNVQIPGRGEAFELD